MYPQAHTAICKPVDPGMPVGTEIDKRKNLKRNTGYQQNHGSWQCKSRVDELVCRTISIYKNMFPVDLELRRSLFAVWQVDIGWENPAFWLGCNRRFVLPTDAAFGPRAEFIDLSLTLREIPQSMGFAFSFLFSPFLSFFSYFLSFLGVPFQGLLREYNRLPRLFVFVN